MNDVAPSSPPKPKRGGARPNAGRKKTRYRHDSPHRARPFLPGSNPLHVVLRVGTWIPELRRGRAYRALRKVLARYLGRADFRVVHISIQQSHLHLLVEAAHKRALTLGMQSFAINAARALQAAFGREGKVFAHRYHATQITSRRYARHALAYVLNNWRRHREDVEHGRVVPARLDRFSSAVSFDGWTEKFRIPAGYEPLPVSPPQTALLQRGWMRYGPIDPYETPGPLVGGPRTTMA